MTLPFRRFEGVVYRGHNPRWAFAPLSGDGAKRRGGRFNPKGTPALYTALLSRTAWLEAQQGLAFKAQPLTLVSYDVDCADILDLTDEATRAASGAPLETLRGAWEDLADRGETPPTWALADRLIAAGCAGVIVPSFTKGASTEDLNFVFWRWSADGAHRLRVIDDDGRLPKNDRSWR